MSEIVWLTLKLGSIPVFLVIHSTVWSWYRYGCISSNTIHSIPLLWYYQLNIFLIVLFKLHEWVSISVITTIMIVVSIYDCQCLWRSYIIIMKIRLLNIDVNEVNNCFSRLILDYRWHSIKQLADYSNLFSIYYLSVWVTSGCQV